MSPTIDIPAPLDDDSDSVVTALEMAAVFAGRGDGAEALRWLKRAAESSGETGDDMRTLLLARSAADLTTHLQEAGVALRTAPPPLPSTPANASETPRPVPSTPAKASETPRPLPSTSANASETPRPVPSTPAKASETPRVLASQAAPMSPILQVSEASANGSASKALNGSSSKAPNGAEASKASNGSEVSQRWLPKAPARPSSVPMGAERPATRPPAPSSRPASPIPPMVEARFSAARELSPRSVAPSARESVSPARDTLTPARDTLTSPIPASVVNAFGAPSAPSVTEINGERRSLSVVSRPSARVERSERPEADPRLHQAARVSVVRSSTERGLFLVRVIEDGKPLPQDAAEGFLVLIDPSASMFSR